MRAASGRQTCRQLHVFGALENAMSDSFNIIVPLRFTFSQQELAELENRPGVSASLVLNSGILGLLTRIS